MTPQTDPDFAQAEKRIRRRHRLAVFAMLVCTLLWSMSGIVIRSLESAAGFEVTFFRSAACTLFLAGLMMALHRRDWLDRITAIGMPGLASAVMWAVMLTAFSIAITMTTVAKTFVLIAVSPLIAALLARYWLGEQIALRTWAAIAIAGAGIVLMVADGLGSNDGLPGSAWGMLIAAAIPVASAINLIILKKSGGSVDMVPAVLVGALISALLMLPFLFPTQASASDMAWLGMLGVFQVAIPGALMILAARWLAPQEIALLALLEVVFAPLWVWLGVGERPADATLYGGVLVLMALIGNEIAGRVSGIRVVRMPIP